MLRVNIAFFCALAAFPVVFAGTMCDGDNEALTKELGQCLLQDMLLTTQVTLWAENPKMMTDMKARTNSTLKLLCENKPYIAAVAECMKQKLAGCLSDRVRTLYNNFMPSSLQMERALDFYCRHSADILAAQTCFDTSGATGIKDCLLSVTGCSCIDTSADDLLPTACDVVSNVESCFLSAHGSCAQRIRHVLTGFMARLFPMEKCAHPAQPPRPEPPKKRPAISEIEDEIWDLNRKQGLNRLRDQRPSRQEDLNLPQGLNGQKGPKRPLGPKRPKVPLGPKYPMRPKLRKGPKPPLGPKRPLGPIRQQDLNRIQFEGRQSRGPLQAP